MAEETYRALQLSHSELQQEKQAVQESLEERLAQVLSEQKTKEKQQLSLIQQLEHARSEIGEGHITVRVCCVGIADHCRGSAESEG